MLIQDSVYTSRFLTNLAEQDSQYYNPHYYLEIHAADQRLSRKCKATRKVQYQHSNFGQKNQLPNNVRLIEYIGRREEE